MENSAPKEIEADRLKELEAWIEQRTEGLIRNVSVELNDGRLIVHGHTESQQVRAVATLALVVLLGAVRTNRVELCVDRVEAKEPLEDPSTRKEVDHALVCD